MPASGGAEVAPPKSGGSLGTTIVLSLIAGTHLAYGSYVVLWLETQSQVSLASSVLLAAGYTIAAWLARHDRSFGYAFGLIVAEDLVLLAAGLLRGYTWAERLLLGMFLVVALQLVLAFVEIERRQSAGQRLRPATLLAWFVVAYSLAFAAYALVKPEGIFSGL